MSHPRIYRSLYVILWTAYGVGAALILTSPVPDLLAAAILSVTAVAGHAFLVARHELAEVRAEYADRLLSRTVVLPPTPKPATVDTVHRPRASKTLASA